MASRIAQHSITRGWRRGPWCHALCVMFACSVSVPVHARGAGDGETPSSVRAAVELGYQALALYQRGQFEAAFLQFSAAEKLAHSPVFALHMGLCLIEMGRWQEARGAFSVAASEQLSADPPPSWKEATERAKSELSALSRRMPKLDIQVEGAPRRQVTLFLDERRVVLTRSELTLDPGPHDIVVSHAGQERRRRVTLTPGQTAIETFTFDAVAAAGPEHETPPAHAASSADSSTRTDTERQLPAADGGRPWMWGAFSIAAAGLAVGSVSGTWAIIEKSRLPCEGRVCEDGSQQETDEVERLANVATVGFVVAGVAGAVGLTLLWTSDDDGDAPAKVSWVLGPTAVGIHGHF